MSWLLSSSWFRLQYTSSSHVTQKHHVTHQHITQHRLDHFTHSFQSETLLLMPRNQRHRVLGLINRLNTHRLAFRSKDQHDPAIKQVIITRWVDGKDTEIWREA